MSGFYSGKEGELFIDGTKVAKVRSWSFSMNQAVLETVSLEDTDRTIIHGTRSYTGSASVYYYQETAGGNGKMHYVVSADNWTKLSEGFAALGTSEKWNKFVASVSPNVAKLISTHNGSSIN